MSMFNRDLFGLSIDRPGSRTLPAPFRGGRVPFVDRLDHKFQAFYRSQLRGVRRHRVRSTALHARLVAWSDDNDLASLGFRGIRREMELIGHRRFLSNGVWFDDVAFVEDVPEIGDTLPEIRSDPIKTVPTALKIEPKIMIERIDAALAELLAIRRQVDAMQDAASPHLAAEQILAGRVA